MNNYIIKSLVTIILTLSPGFIIAKNITEIDSGIFLMGCSTADSNCGKDEGSQGGVSIYVDKFYIDKMEVSVAEYKKCIHSGNCTTPKNYKRNNYCNLDAPNREHHPINCVDWNQAKTYCEWKNGRLPFEAEWEKAARAGSNSRYPWGQNVTCKHAVLDDGSTLGSVPNEPDGCGEDRTWERGSRPANAFGLYDMHGNAGEWTANWYSSNAIKTLYAAGDIKGPSISKQRVVRGGSWDENKYNLRSSYRNVKPPVSGNIVYGSIGFRCAYDAK